MLPRSNKITQSQTEQECFKCESCFVDEEKQNKSHQLCYSNFEIAPITPPDKSELVEHLMLPKEDAKNVRQSTQGMLSLPFFIDIANFAHKVLFAPKQKQKQPKPESCVQEDVDSKLGATPIRQETRKYGRDKDKCDINYNNFDQLEEVYTKQNQRTQGSNFTTTSRVEPGYQDKEKRHINPNSCNQSTPILIPDKPDNYDIKFDEHAEDCACHSKEPSPYGITKFMKSFNTVNRRISLLHNFVSQGDLKNLRRILENERVNVNCLKPPGVALLHEACVWGHLECVQLLVEYGADLNLNTWQGISPLKLAVSNGHFDVAVYLIANGAKSEEILNGF